MTCSKCGIEFTPLPCYERKGDWRCPTCRAAQARAWKIRSAEHVREYDRQQRLLHPEKFRAKENRRDQKKRYAQKWAAHWDKMLASDKARRAVRSGRLIRQPCETCGSTVVHGHHDDYSKPLQVRWLCPRHHAEVHHPPDWKP